MRYLLIFLTLLLSGLCEAQIRRPFTRQHHSLNKDIYSQHRVNKPVDAYSNTVSFVQPGNIYYDGDYSKPFHPGWGIYYPCETFIELGGTYNVKMLKVFETNTGATFTVKSGNDIFSLTTDTVLTLNTGLVQTVNMKNKNVKFLSYTISSSTYKDGPAEVEIYSYPVTIDVIPPITLRPNISLENMIGWNADEFTSLVIPYDSASIRQYEYNSKLVRKAGGNIFSFNPGYDQGLNFDQTYRDVTAAGKKSLPLFFDALGFDSVWKPSYDALGLTWNTRYRNILAGANASNPSSWAVLARLGYQYALRYGKVAGSTSNTRVEPNNASLTGLNLVDEIELGNEHDQWWDSDTNKFILPVQQFWKMSAIWDGHEGLLGARHGIKNADPNFGVVQSALADFNYGYNKIIYHAAKKYRTDGVFPANTTNYHSYLTEQGGQHNSGDRGISPELYKRPGYKAVGLEQYVLEHGDFELRYLPGTRRYYSEFGYDSNKESITGVPMLTEAQAQAAPMRMNTWEVQGALLQRLFVGLMKSRAFDRGYVFTYFDYDFYGRGLPDYASDTRNPNNNASFYSQYGGAQQFAQSGVVLGQYAWVLGITSSPVNLLTAVGTNITFNLPKDRAYYPFPTGTGAVQVRFAAEEHGGPEQYAWQGNKMFGTIVSQNDSVVVLNITSSQLSTNGAQYQQNNITQWRFDTPYAPKTSKHMIDNMFAVMHDCKFAADSSKGSYKDYRFTNSSGRTVAMVWLPTQTWNQINNVQINVGNATSVTHRINNSRTGATQSLSISGSKVTINVNEMPKFIFWDGTGTSNSDPIVSAGADKSISTTSTTFTATASDPGGSISSYLWTKIAGGTATLSGTTTATLSLSGLAVGSYTFRCTVTDNLGATAYDDVMLSVSGASNQPPVVAFLGSVTTTNSTIDLWGSASDADGTVVSYAWTKLTGGSCVLTNPNAAHVTISGLTTGSYTFRLTATDNLGATDTEDCPVTVNLAGNVSPTANAGANKTITGTTTSFVGSGSDPDGTIASYAWTKQSGGTATLSGASTATLALSNLAVGTYVFRLTVTDNNGGTGFDDVTLTVNSGGGGLTASEWVDTEYTASWGAKFKTQVRLPIGYGNGTAFPVIVFLHGQGEKYDGGKSHSWNVANLKSTALPYYLDHGLEIPFIVICPQTGYANFDLTGNDAVPTEPWVDRPGLAAKEFADWAVSTYGGDPQRCHITGLSMGGASVYTSIVNYPNRWATALPICASPLGYPLADNIRCVLWAIATEFDGMGNPSAVQAFVNQANKSGNISAPCWFSIYCCLGHAGWNQTYGQTWTNGDLKSGWSPNKAPEDIYAWMAKYKIVSGVISEVP
jgi:hypothetical protein